MTRSRVQDGEGEENRTNPIVCGGENAITRAVRGGGHFRDVLSTIATVLGRGARGDEQFQLWARWPRSNNAVDDALATVWLRWSRSGWSGQTCNQTLGQQGAHGRVNPDGVGDNGKSNCKRWHARQREAEGDKRCCLCWCMLWAGAGGIEQVFVVMV